MSKTFDTWPELEAHLMTISDQHLEREEGTLVRFAYPYKDELFAVFFVRKERPNGSTWVFAAVRLAKAARFDLDQLMRVTTREPAGALAMKKDYLCVTHNLPVRGLHADHIEWTLRALCDAHIEYEKLKLPRPADA